jgi:hypothetical protein
VAYNNSAKKIKELILGVRVNLKGEGEEEREGGGRGGRRV